MSFVSHDLEDWKHITISNLLEGTPTVVVTEDAVEILFVPRRGLNLLWILDRALGRVPVEVRWRHGAHEYGIETRIDRGRLAHFERELQLA